LFWTLIQVKDLENQSIRDPLTGLYNRRFLGEYLEKEFAQLNRAGGDLSIIIVDIDNFKEFNDTYGHSCGDSILKKFSELLDNNFRSSDILCRYGGNEFLIALSGSDLDDALIKAQVLQKKVAEEQVSCDNYSDVQVTLLIGIAGYPTHGIISSDEILSVDKALYLAKDKGKTV
jgi:diguanylate cyclase (GGDEF)-like protein